MKVAAVVADVAIDGTIGGGGNGKLETCCELAKLGSDKLRALAHMLLCETLAL